MLPGPRSPGSRRASNAGPYLPAVLDEDEENVFEDEDNDQLAMTGHSLHPADDNIARSSEGVLMDVEGSGVEGAYAADLSAAVPSALEGEPAEVNPFEMDQSATAAAIASLPPAPAPAHFSAARWAEMAWSTATNKERLQQFCYSHSILLSVIIQVLMLIFFAIVEPTAIKYHVTFSPFMAFLVVVCQLMQVIVLTLAHIGMMKELTALYVRPGKIWNMYLSVVLGFAAMYFTFFCFQRSSFQVDGYAADGKDDTDTTIPDDTPYEDLQTANDIPTIFVYFCYFSGAIMTSTGFGDIAPTLWYSQAFTNAQMLLGTMYHVGVFGLTLSHFRTFQKVSEAKEAAELASGYRSRTRKVLDYFLAIPWVARIRAHPYTDRFKRFCIKYLVLVCVIFQTFNVMLLLSIPDPFRSLKPSDGAAYQKKVVVLTFITLFQTAMFIGVMYVSIRLVKKINNADITAGFLIQSFLATALLFGGIYFVLFAATPNHQFSRNTAFDLTVFEVLYVFVHFSLTVMTTTGFGDVYARGIIARCFVLLQMLISILYSAVIIGLGTSQLIDMQAAKAEQDFKQKEEAAVEKQRVDQDKQVAAIFGKQSRDAASSFSSSYASQASSESSLRRGVSSSLSMDENVFDV